ncbi:DUF2306 domain-containing protein [Psychroflexus sp. S27]|uniref:DUF2306 domain-containing protein n=1 Tax=Psychroflexus sp. S27 TaxID=1982757 RepID=UPI000C2A8134|nr:DUF2306 domain-containing protein [Psychroflexus sp. S27]PJX24480.1 DUF2306 domain-containing protein [Psychroflexus sp. S27]
MEKYIYLLIIIHASFGGIALIAGFIALIFKKGKNIHRKSGLVFFYGMILSGISALIISVLPNHENPFLFAIGIFSLYFVITGKRALNFKKKNPVLMADKLISVLMIFTGTLMIFLPYIYSRTINLILVVFAIVGIFFSVKDLLLYRKPDRLRKAWLKLHLGKMIGGFISATTAFVVVNNFISGISAWFIPGIIGGFIIFYWIKKVAKPKVTLKK